MRYLGLDLGTKTLGIALTDKSNTIVTPLKIVKFDFEDYQSLIPVVKELIDEYNIGEIALGLPKNMDGSLGFASNRSLNFKNMLEENISVPITLIDERLTSVEAHNILHNNGKKEIDHKKNIDAVAATIILETFLKRKENEND